MMEARLARLEIELTRPYLDTARVSKSKKATLTAQFSAGRPKVLQVQFLGGLVVMNE